jgi:hypothetical protein
VATIVNTTHIDQVKATGVTTYTLTIPAVGAGNKLVLCAFGGATITAKITNSGGAAFTSRGQAASTQAVSIHDFTAVGGETAVFVTLNGAENTSYVILELSGAGAFVAASTGIPTPAQANDWQSKPSSTIAVTGNSVLIAAWSVTNTAAVAPFGLANRWRQMGPLGSLVANFGNQPGSAAQFIAAVGVADVTAAGAYPATAAAGSYQATSVWNQNSVVSWSVQVAYSDASGVPTVTAPANPVAGENTLPGTDQGNWYPGLNGGTNATIAGYCDKTSYQPGDTVNFKIDSSGFTFRVELCRLGWYGGENFGARSVLGNQGGYIPGTVVAQSAPTVDGTLGSTSCAWTTNATWPVPAGAVPGVYHVVFRRTDAGNTANFSTGVFVVRPASVQGKIVNVVPDTTWQAYNLWGATTDNGVLGVGTWTGRSLYAAGSDGATGVFGHRAYAVSFDRPYGTQAQQANTYLYDAEYGSIHFAEAQGYDLTYLSTLDLDNDPTILTRAALVHMNGHHEYWTTNVYNAFTAADDAKVNMLITASNVALWHTRYAVADTSKRTMICYKESGSIDVNPGFDGGTGRDPVSYTGTWRDARTAVAPNNTDVRRENALTGQIFAASTPSNIQTTVPFASKGLPIWRNSATIQALTAGNVYTNPYANIGDEVELPDGSAGQPANLVQLSPTVASWANGANANGTTYHTTLTSVTASFTVYRRYSGALIFNTGSWRGWWGLSRFAKGAFAGAVTAVSLDWQNAFLACLYDLGATPAAITALRPGIDTAPTNPATGAPTGGRTGVTRAYGLRAEADGAFMITTG